MIKRSAIAKVIIQDVGEIAIRCNLYFHQQRKNLRQVGWKYLTLLSITADSDATIVDNFFGGKLWH